MSVVFWIAWIVGVAIAFPLLTRWAVRHERPEEPFEYALAAYVAFAVSLMWPIVLAIGLIFFAFAEFGRRIGGAKDRAR